MFKMKIEKQLNTIADRTLILGIPDYNVIPSEISANNNKYKVIGVTNGIKLPYMSLEIEKTDDILVGISVTA